jgi:hypothetical protein
MDGTMAKKGAQKPSYRTWTRFINWLKCQMEESTATLAVLPFLLGIIFLGIANWICQLFYPMGVPKMISNTITCTTFLIFGTTGIIFVVRREVPYSLILRGIPAIIVGILWWMFFWGIAIFGFWRILAS